MEVTTVVRLGLDTDVVSLLSFGAGHTMIESAQIMTEYGCFLWMERVSKKLWPSVVYHKYYTSHLDSRGHWENLQET